MKQKVQEGKSYDEYVGITREEIESLLLGLNIPHRRVKVDDYGFSREIEFEVGDDTYSILWFKNQSTLRLGKSKGAPEIPFRHMFHDRTHPNFNSKGGALGFCYDRYVRNSVFDREFPFESLRIPLQNAGK